MASEKDWVRTLHPGLNKALESCSNKDWTVCVDSGKRLTYAYEILRYNSEGPAQTSSAGYETDLLVYDLHQEGDWIPRVVVECKTGSVTTHDALTYSTKATTHKHVHPYLRYGVLVGDFGTALPGRLIRHGALFDFMMVWAAQEPTPVEWQDLVRVLADEIEASRTLQLLLSENRLPGRQRFQLLHRPLKLTPSDH